MTASIYIIHPSNLSVQRLLIYTSFWVLHSVSFQDTYLVTRKRQSILPNSTYILHILGTDGNTILRATQKISYFFSQLKIQEIKSNICYTHKNTWNAICNLESQINKKKCLYEFHLCNPRNVVKIGRTLYFCTPPFFFFI